MKVWVLRSTFLYGDADNSLLGVFASLELAQGYVARYSEHNPKIVFDSEWNVHSDGPWADRDYHLQGQEAVPMFFAATEEDVIENIDLLDQKYWDSDRVS